jgi:hypothetical protein
MEQGASPENNQKGSHVRWQSITIGQLTYAVNLILGLSVAVLGFEISLLLNENFSPGSCLQRVSLFFSLVLLAVSIVFGVLVVINRLTDFRLTTSIARRRE